MKSGPAHLAAIAAASDGSVLINLVAELPVALQAKLAQALGAAVFVGVELSEHEAHQVVERLDDAAAEASARLMGVRRAKPGPSVPKKRSKQGPGRSARR